MAVYPRLMMVDYAGNLDRIGRNIGAGIQGYKRGQTQELAGQAMMGDPSAMEGLMMRDPAMAAQVQDRLSAQQAAQQQQEQAILGKLAEEKRDLFERLGGAETPEDFVANATRAVQVGMYPTIASTMGKEDQFDVDDFNIARTFYQMALDPQEKTALLKEMDAAGIDPASPEGQQLIRDRYAKASTNINIGGQGEDGFGASKKKFAEKLAEKQANQWETQTEAASSAEENIAAADEMLTLLNQGLETGGLTPLRAGVDKLSKAAFGFSLTGVDPDMADRFQGLSTKLSRQLRQPGEEPRSLNDREILHLAKIVMIAGGGTSWRQMGITLLALLTHRDQMDAVIADRSRMDDVIEESLRWNPTAPLFYRWVMKDTELYGHQLKKGDVVEVGIGPANRDPARWDNPDAFDINRPKFTNMAFGLGVHRCLGMNVAKVEITQAINALLDAFPNMRLDPDAPTPIIGGGLEQRGPTAVPVLLR